jgi:hypothetical protein
MKYLLILFYLTSQWPMPAQIKWAQLGPYDTLFACEAAAAQAEHIVRSVGAVEVGSFCSGTKDASFKLKGK